MGDDLDATGAGGIKDYINTNHATLIGGAAIVAHIRGQARLHTSPREVAAQTTNSPIREDLHLHLVNLRLQAVGVGATDVPIHVLRLRPNCWYAEHLLHLLNHLFLLCIPLTMPALLPVHIHIIIHHTITKDTVVTSC